MLVFTCGSSTYESILAHPCLGFPHVLHFHHPLNFTSITCLMNGIAFANFTRPKIWISWFYFSSMSWTIYTCLYARHIQLLPIQRLDCFSCSMDLNILVHVFSHPLAKRISFRLFPCPLVRRTCLKLIFLCFILSLRKAYRRYISVSRDFIRLGPLAFLWMKLCKLEIHTSYTLGIQTIYT